MAKLGHGCRRCRSGNNKGSRRAHLCSPAAAQAQLSDPLPPGALDGVTVIMSAASESCDEACGKQGGACSAQHLAIINSCDKLRELVSGSNSSCGVLGQPEL